MSGKRVMALLLGGLLGLLFLAGCQASGGLKDGYYTAKAAEYDFGWKEFVTITVKAGEIVAVEYNAENPSGFIKSWDNAYMKNMKTVTGTYPNEYTRDYAAQLVALQTPEGVSAIAGASTSASSFQQLALAVIEQARKGDSQTVIVNIT